MGTELLPVFSEIGVTVFGETLFLFLRTGRAPVEAVGKGGLRAWACGVSGLKESHLLRDTTPKAEELCHERLVRFS